MFLSGACGYHSISPNIFDQSNNNHLLTYCNKYEFIFSLQQPCEVGRNEVKTLSSL